MKNKVALSVNTWGQSNGSRGHSKCCEVQGTERRPEGWRTGAEGSGRKAGARSCVAAQVMTRSLDFTDYNAMSVGYGCVTTHKTKSLPF